MGRVGRPQVALLIAVVVASSAAFAAGAFDDILDRCDDIPTGLVRPEQDWDLQRYIGLSVAEARKQGERDGAATVRVVCEADRSLLGTSDLRPDRINVGIRDGRVVGVAVY